MRVFCALLLSSLLSGTASAKLPAPEADAGHLFDGTIKRPKLAVMAGDIPTELPVGRLGIETRRPPTLTEQEPRPAPSHLTIAERDYIMKLLKVEAPPPPRYLLGDRWGPGMMAIAEPAYGVLENVSDGIYDFFSARFIARLLPDELGSEVEISPEDSSFEVFDKKFHEKELRFFQRLRDTQPNTGRSDFRKGDEAEYAKWKEWAAREQSSLVIDSFKDTMLQRYRVQRFGDTTEDYALDSSHWDPHFLALATVVGGTFLYLNGLHASASVFNAKIGIDLSAGRRAIKALQGNGEISRAVGIDLRYKDSPFSANADWDIKNRTLLNRYTGLKFQKRF